MGDVVQPESPPYRGERELEAPKLNLENLDLQMVGLADYGIASPKTSGEVPLLE